MAKEWEIEGLTPDEPFREAAGKILRTKSAEMWHYAPGTIAGEDIEELHSMRVSSRRLRAAVDMCAPCYPKADYARFQRVVNDLTAELGAVRDADVMLDFLQSERKRVTPAERAGLDDLIERVRQQREALRPHMIAYLHGLIGEDFQRRFERFVSGEQ
jgi:CHAD domain-containing protein